MTDCNEGSFVRASRLGAYRCLQDLGWRGWVFEFAESVVAFNVWGLGVGVKMCGCLDARRPTDCVEGGFVRASRLGVYRCL